MLTKSFVASIFLLAFTTSVHAHAGVSPALGVKGNSLQRNDVQRPNKQNPCGAVDIAKNLNSSTPIQANADGTFSTTVTNFNPGADGSRSIKTAEVDPSGTGQSFNSQATVLANGDPNPKNDTSEKITVKLPDGTKCGGGANKNLCLVSFTTSAGFGNCVAVSQGAGAAKRESSTDAAKPVRNGTAKGTSPSDKKATKGKHSDKKKAQGKASDKGKPKAKASGNDKSQPGSARRMTPERRYNPFRNGAAKGVPPASPQARQLNPPARRMTPRRHWSSRS